MGLFGRKRLIMTGRRGTSASRPPWRRALPGLVLAMIAIGLLVLSRNEPRFLTDARQTITSFAAPALYVLRTPLEPFRGLARQVAFTREGAAELDRLRAQVQELQGWKWRAKDLERRLKDLEALARKVDGPGLKFVTSEVLAHAPDGLQRTFLIGVGSYHGIKPGLSVIGAGGLIGMIDQVGPRAARVVLLTAPSSRIDVSVGREQINARLIGRGRPGPALELEPGSPPIASGDVVVTSGGGGRMPRGLRIGEVKRGPEGVSVELAVRPERLEYVSVLFHGVPAFSPRTPRDDAAPPAGNVTSVPAPRRASPRVTGTVPSQKR